MDREIAWDCRASSDCPKGDSLTPEWNHVAGQRGQQKIIRAGNPLTDSTIRSDSTLQLSVIASSEGSRIIEIEKVFATAFWVRSGPYDCYEKVTKTDIAKRVNWHRKQL